MAVARRSWVLRGVIRGFSEEARTGGFPSASFGGFGFLVVTTNYSRKLPDCLIGNIIGTYSGVGNVCFGSKAAAQYEPNSSTRVAGFGVKRTVATQRRRLLPGVKRTSTLQFKAQHGRNIFAQNN